MARERAKYDPLEQAKIGTDRPPPAPPVPFPKPEEAEKLGELEEEEVMPPADMPPKPPRYRLMASKRVSIRGNVCDWKAGREISSQGYDIEHLRGQGCELELIED